MPPANKQKKICTKFEPQAWRKVLCKNCFKTQDDHGSSGTADKVAKGPPSSPDEDPNQKDIIRKCLGTASINPVHKLRHSVSLENVTSDERPQSSGLSAKSGASSSAASLARRSVSPSFGETSVKSARPSTPFVDNKYQEILLNEPKENEASDLESSDECGVNSVIKESDSTKESTVKINVIKEKDLKNILQGASTSNQTRPRTMPSTKDAKQAEPSDEIKDGQGGSKIQITEVEKNKTNSLLVSKADRKLTEAQQQASISNTDAIVRCTHAPPTPSQEVASSSDDADNHANSNSFAAKTEGATGEGVRCVAESLINNTLGRNGNSPHSVNHCVNSDAGKNEIPEKGNGNLLPQNLNISDNTNRINNTFEKCNKNVVLNTFETETGKDSPSPVQFYYDGTKIEDGNSRQKSLIIDDSLSVNYNLDTSRYRSSEASHQPTTNNYNTVVELNPVQVSGIYNLADKYRNYSNYSSDLTSSRNNFGVVSPDVETSKRHRTRSFCDDEETMTSYDFLRSEAMLEGKRLLLESLRERNAALEEQCQKVEREKTALGDLLTNKKIDYERMKEHFNATIADLESQVQRLNSEKNRLLDKLQLPESERSSLAAEENVIAELRQKLEEYEYRFADIINENEDLRQDVRDLQLEMAELHDQFREEETLEFRELQKELEAAAKNCRILQFKLRKGERHNEQLENDRAIYEEKLRHFESCIQSSDDKRKVRMLEEEMRATKEANQRLHEELGRTEEKRRRNSEDLDRTKNSLNEADSKRLCLQNEVDNMKHDISKLREQLKYENRQESVASAKSASRNSISADNAIINQLTKDLKDSLERENDLKEQLKFTEKECATMRKKLTDVEAESESLNMQLRKLTTPKPSKFPKSKSDSNVGSNTAENEGPMTESESDLVIQLELSEQEVKSMKAQVDELQQDNDNLLLAIKYLRSKLEQRDGMRCSTPFGDSKSTRDLLMRIGAISDPSDCEEELRSQLEASKKEYSQLQDKYNQLLKDRSTKQRPSVSDASVNTTEEENRLEKEEEFKRVLQEQLNALESRCDELARERVSLKEELSSKVKKAKEQEEIISQLRSTTKELESLKETKENLDGNANESTKHLEDSQKDIENYKNNTETDNKPSVKESETELENKVIETNNKPSVKESESETELKNKVIELQDKLKQKELEWAKEIGTIEEEANVGCDIATKINRELSSLNESLMDEKEKLLKEKEKLIKENIEISAERDKLLEESEKAAKGKAPVKETNDVKPNEDNVKQELQKQFSAEKAKLEDRIGEYEPKIKELEKKNESLEKKRKKDVARREKDENEKRELQEEMQVLKDKFERKLQKETEKRRRSEAFLEDNKGSELEMLSKMQKEIDDKDKSIEKLNKKLRKAEDVQMKLEVELKTLQEKTTATLIIPNKRSPGDGEDGHVTDENANQVNGKSSENQTTGQDVSWYQEQIKNLQAENEKLSKQSQKSIADIKSLFDKEQNSRGKDRDEMANLKKTVEDHHNRQQKSDKEIEDLKEKLRQETSAKLRLENKLKALESGVSPDVVSETKKPSPLTSDEKKAIDFRNRFEKFGGTPRNVKRLSIPSTFDTSSSSTTTATTPTSSSSSSSSSADVLKDLQKQIADLEAARAADRDELMKKIEKQRNEFEKEAVALKTKNENLDDRLREWTKCQQDILENQLEFEKERVSWSEERGKLQVQLDLALGSSTPASDSKDNPTLIIPSSQAEDQNSSQIGKSSKKSSSSQSANLKCSTSSGMY